MSQILIIGQNIIVSNEKSFIYHSIGSKEYKYITLPKSSSNTNSKISEMTEKKSSEKDVIVNFVCCALSSDNTLLAIQSNEKILFVYKVQSWEIICEKLLSRGASKIIFTPDNRNVLVGDKTGDVYLFPIFSHDKETLIFGHLSIILDITMTSNGKYIITCDRDEKIRVSNYPNCYNIEQYCLGHKEFVTNIKLLPHNTNYLISSSGDGTLKIWDYLSGNLKDSFDFNQDSNFSGPDDEEQKQLKCFTCMKLNESTSIICVSVFKCNTIFVFIIQLDKFLFLNTLSLDFKPLHLQLGSLGKDISNGANVCSNEIHLWVLQSDNKLMCYSWNDSDRKFISISDDLVVLESLNLLNSNLKHFDNDDKRSENIIFVLQKRKMDEVNDYYTKKQARIEKKYSKLMLNDKLKNNADR